MRLGITPQMSIRVAGLHSCTVVRTPSGDSSVYQLFRGFREWCPSSCVLFNVTHNLVLQSLKHQFRELGVRFDAVGPSGHCESKSLELVSFADDTTGVTHVSGQPHVETAICDTLRQLGHKAHPDKFERLAARLNAACGTSTVRFLGHHTGADGSTREDTKQRLASARQIWWKLKKQSRSSVCHSVFVVGFLNPQCSRVSYTVQKYAPSRSHRHWVFAGKCIRHLYHRKCYTSVLTYMKEKHLTMTDLRCELGLKDVERSFAQRQCSYLGHLVRLPSDRVERSVLSLSMGTLSAASTPQGNMFSRQVRRHSEVPEEQWELEWVTFAGAGREEPDRGGAWRRAS